MPFYKTLTDGPRRARLAVVGTEAQDILHSYTSAAGLKPDMVVSVAPGALKLPATPILVLVSPDGKVQQLWRGMLTSQQQDEVRRMIQ